MTHTGASEVGIWGTPGGPGETFWRFPVYCELKGEGMRRRDPLLLLVENSKKCAFSI